MWTKEAIKALKGWERPTVRCKLDDDSPATCERSGRIVPDVNPWVEVFADGRWVVEQFSWGLVLDVLNDRFAAPIVFSRQTRNVG